VTISVVVATLGRSAVFERCLQAIASGTYGAAEIVVVDQSPEGIGGVAASALAASAARARHVRTAPVGVSAARNLGTREAAGDLLAFTDDDCVPDGRWLEELVLALERAGAGAATGRVLPLDDGLDGRVAVSSRTDTRERVVGGHDGVAPWSLGTGGNLLVRTDVFRLIGGFDEEFGPGARYRAAEDIEFLERLLEAGSSVAYAPSAVVYHEMKTPRERLRRRYPYGFGMGALVAKAERPRRRRLATDYLLMQVRATAAATRARSARRLAEPPLSAAGFTAGFVAARTARAAPGRGSRPGSRPAR
jgi:GT2 family glycosyltransferase